MELRDREDLVKELKELVKNSKTDIDCPEITSSQFYQLMQNEVKLVTTGAFLESEELLLVAKIAASSPTLEAIDFSNSPLGKNGPAIACALSKSSTIKSVNFMDSDLAEFSPETIKCLADLVPLRELALSGDELSKYPPKTAKEISKLRFLESINFSTLQELAPKIAANLAKSKTLKKVFMCELDGTYCLETAEAFKGPKSSLTVAITSLESLSPDQKAAIRAIAETNNEQVVKNIQNIVSFLCINNCPDMQYPLPKEIVCQIAGNLDYNTLEFVLN